MIAIHPAHWMPRTSRVMLAGSVQMGIVSRSAFIFLHWILKPVEICIEGGMWKIILLLRAATCSRNPDGSN